MRRGKHIRFLSDLLLFTLHNTPNPNNWSFTLCSTRVLRKELHDDAALVQEPNGPITDY